MSYVAIMLYIHGHDAADVEVTDVVGPFSSEIEASTWATEVGLPNPGGWAANTHYQVWAINPPRRSPV